MEIYQQAQTSTACSGNKRLCRHWLSDETRDKWQVRHYLFCWCLQRAMTKRVIAGTGTVINAVSLNAQAWSIFYYRECRRIRHHKPAGAGTSIFPTAPSSSAPPSPQ